MNKIFKVIWNEARNAYVVVSEIAKNHGSKSCSTKKLLAMLIATGVMTCASFDVLAEQPAADKTAAQQYVALKAVDFKARPTISNMDSWKDSFGGDLLAALREWNAQKDGTKQIGEYTYTYDRTNKYWVRNGYVLTVDQKGGKYTQLSQKDVRADVAYTGTGVPEGILQSVTSTVAHNGVVTHSGDPLQKITAGSFAGVSHSGGTEVAGSWDYIINDASWEGSVDVGNYKDGYVDLIGNKMPKGFKTIGSGLEWDTAKQTYTYKGKAVDYRNMYVIDGNLGVFTNADGSEVYTGTVYGKNNEILMTVKDNGKFYSYWAASVTDPSATMETYPVSKYNSDLAVIDKNIKDLNKDIIKEVTLTKGDDSAIIGLVRNGGKAVDGAITVTSGGGTDGNDTFVKISNGTTEQTFATGSKVEAIVDKGATTGIKINGEDYTIKSGSKVSVTQNAAEKTTTITVDDTATTITDTDTHNELKSASLSGKTLTITGKDNDSVNVDLSSIDTDTKYTAGNGIAIDENKGNAISVKLKEDEKNLEVTADGLELKKALTVNSVAAGDFYMSTAGIGYDDKAYITSSGLNANSQKITGVADGTIAEGSKDAVNGSQLNAVKETANKGWKLSIGKGEAVNVAPGEIVDFSGDDNIKVSNTGKDVKVELEKNLTGLTSVTTENAYVTNVNASNNESVTNVEYVKKQIAGVTLTEGKGISITDKKINVKLKDGEENLKVDETGLYLRKDLTGMESITGVGGGKISFATGGNVTIKDITFNNDGRIQGVVAGKDDNDAVNVGQLNKVVAAGDTDVHIKAGNYTVDKDNKVSMNLVDKAGKSQGTVTITGVAKAEDVAVVYDKNKTSLRSTNATLQTSSGKEEAVDSIALGNGASAVKGSVAIGNGASVVEGSNGLGGVALGYKAHAGYKGTSLGSNAISGREGTTLVGANTNSGSLYTTVVGTDSVINSDGTTYKVVGIKKELNVQGATATVVGSKNTVDNKNGKVYSGVANNVMGSANTVEGSNGVTIQGTGNKVTDAYKDMNIDAFEAYNIGKGDYSALAKKKSGAVAVIGGGNTVSKQTDSTVIGFGNTVAGDADNISHDVFVAGSRNNLSKVSDSIVMGNDNEISDKSNVISLGHENSIKANNAVAIGNGASVSAEGGVALGVGSVASTAANALGYGAAEGETGIAWKATNGAVSVGSSVEGKKITRQITNVAAGTEDTDAVNVAQLKKVSEAAASASQGWKLKTKKGNASDVKPGATVEFDGDANIQVGNDGNKVSVTLKKQLTGIQSITGAGEGAGSISFADGGKVKVNDVIIEKGGKITGVADGKISKDSTDAVNGSQLNAVKETANKGWNLSTGKGKAVNVAPGETVDFSGDDNIVVSNTGNNVVVKLGKELTGLTSVTTNNAYVTKVDASKNESVTNVGYVNNQIAGVTLTEGKGISITDKKINVKLKDGEENLKVDETGLYLRKDLTGMESITGVGGGSISFSGGNVTINNNVTFGSNGQIHNVTAGTASTDAVNVGQLNAAVQAGNTDTHIKAGEYGVGTDNKVNMQLVDKNGKDAGTVTITDVAKASDVGNVTNINNDLKNPNGTTTVVDAVNNLNQKLDNKVGDLNYVEGGKGNYVTNGENTTTSIGKLDQALKDVEATAAKHTTVTQGVNITVTKSDEPNENGGENYNVALKKDIELDSVTTGQTVMNNDGVKVGTDVSLNKDGLKVGDKVSVSATAVTAGKTSISDEGVKVGDKTYISADGLNANGQHITNVKAGEADTDAVNYGQLKDTNNRINGVENQVISNSNRINQLSNRVNKVGAGAAALAALHPMDFDPDDKLTFSAGYGNYGGENAAAIGAYYRPDEKVMFSVGGTVGNGENMVNAGVSFALDRTNHVSNSRTALAREVIDLRGQLAVMGAKMAKMEKALGMLDETKTKLFPDIPANHWAYEYIAKLAGNGYIEGYPDGNFGGDRLMTRYEFAAMLYRAIENGAALEEKIIKEFEPELGRIRVDRISGEDSDRDKIERVRVNDTKGERDHYGNKLAK